MAQTKSLVRNRHASRLARRGAFCAGWIAALYGAFLLSGCVSPVTQASLVSGAYVEPELRIDENVMIAHDGMHLGLTVWEAEGVEAPSHVVVGVHGMNDYAGAFRLAAPYWAARGVTTYAYDQRGFGRSPNKGIWPDEELMREDVRTATALVRARHPDAVVTIVGISMGGAAVLSTMASDRPADADRVISSGTGLRGWGAVNPVYNVSLWAAAHTRPGWVVTPPRRLVTIMPTDNEAILREQGADPHMTFENRIDQVYGVVSLMESGHKAVADLPPSLPVLMSYGKNDIVIPENGVRRTAKTLPQHVRTVYYENGYHMLTRDLQGDRVNEDYLAFMKAPHAALPSGDPEWPFRPIPNG